mmetsp:Transcript_11808/g.19239  ORF Transcript_11808/g.19239 Transcript_11808/m.19239 type:complete len:746 (-) Transcript_11808:1341-3578(-)|eukprot:CAMPEP_0203746184 /NCGR_PEP_ID=MMETSP0098-20131031/1697_1 /ASSEMBLY_ACC=CAM_ASM_000208 /TAXON_ID=96639 /ORGANISM=" , Strain NY0313808BC1" /LENGTH=745 /DNA_ID=CAMNT_0050634183 /DNA_START=74 /DNA_END=2311 /DNA_ORIENTATION=+
MDKSFRALGIGRKRVSLGIDIGTQFVRACTWSLSKRRPEILTLSRSNGGALVGPGCEFLGYPFIEDEDEREKVRCEFVTKVAQIFEKVIKAVGCHYNKEQEMLHYRWVVVTTSSDESFYRLAVEDAAAKSPELPPIQFLSTALAGCLGEGAYQQVRIQQGKAKTVQESNGKTLVIDIGASCSRLGLVDVEKTFVMHHVKSVVVTDVTNEAFIEAIEKQLILESDQETLTEEKKLALKAESREICFDLLQTLGSEKTTEQEKMELYKTLEWFKRVTRKLFEKLNEAVAGLLDLEGEEQVKVRVVLLGGGAQIPALYKSLFSGTTVDTLSIFYPKWTPNVYVTAMGAAVLSGIMREDKSCAFSAFDINMNALYLGILDQGKLIHKVKLVDAGAPIEASRTKSLTLENLKSNHMLSVVTIEEPSAPGEHLPTANIICECDISASVEKACRLKVRIAKLIAGHRVESTIEVWTNVENRSKRELIMSKTVSDRNYRDVAYRKMKHNKATKAVTFHPPDEDEDEASHKIAKTVILHILRAEGLAKADTWGKSDPYVVVTFNNDMVGKTHIERKTLNPVWDEKLYLSIPGNVLNKEDKLCLDLFDHDTFSSDDFMGRVCIPGDVVGSHKEERWYDFTTRDDLPSKKQKFVKGKLSIRFSHHEFKITQSMISFQDFQEQEEQHRKPKKSPKAVAAPKPWALMQEEESDSSDDSEEEGLFESEQYLKRRWRVLSGNVPVHGFAFAQEPPEKPTK